MVATTMLLGFLLSQAGTASEPVRLIRQRWELSVQPMLSEAPLVDESGRTSQTDQVYLTVLVILKNKSPDRPLSYTSWGSGTRPNAIVEDDQGNRFRLATFGSRRVEGSVLASTIAPGSRVLDVLVFERPSETSRSFVLRLRGANIGETEDLFVSFSAAALAISETDPEEPPPAPELPAKLPSAGPMVRQLPSSTGGKISLPSGKEFDASVFDVDARGRLHELQRHFSVAHGNHPNGRLAFIASHTRGVLDGGLFAYDSEGQLMLYAIYKSGARDGFVRSWEGNRDVYQCQYKDGRRHGYCCYTSPTGRKAIVEYRANRVEEAHLVVGEKVVKSFSTLEAAAGDSAMQPTLSEMEKTEAEILDKEKSLRKAVAATDLQQRNKIASQLNPKKRAAIQERSDQKFQERQSRINEIRRRAAGL